MVELESTSAFQKEKWYDLHFLSAKALFMVCHSALLHGMISLFPNAEEVFVKHPVACLKGVFVHRKCMNECHAAHAG